MDFINLTKNHDLFITSPIHTSCLSTTLHIKPYLKPKCDIN